MPEAKPGPVVRKKDNRPSNLQFKEFGGARVALILDSFERLAKFGSSYKRRPSLAQVEWVEKTLTESLAKVFAELRRGLQTNPDAKPEKRQMDVPL